MLQKKNKNKNTLTVAKWNETDIPLPYIFFFHIWVIIYERNTQPGPAKPGLAQLNANQMFHFFKWNFNVKTFSA